MIVTGGSGFIGSNLVNFLIQKNILLLILINLHILQIDMMRKKEIKNFINTIKLI